MEIGAPKAKGTHPCPSRMGIGAVNPRAHLRVHVERPLAKAALRIRLRHPERRGQHLVVQSQNRLGQARDSGGGFGVPDHRLDRADRAALGRSPCLL